MPRALSPMPINDADNVGVDHPYYDSDYEPDHLRDHLGHDHANDVDHNNSDHDGHE